jgi:hypothetical protein
MGVTDADTDPVAAFRARLQDLYIQVRRPTYRSLEAHADRDGRALRTSTIGSLLNGPGTPAGTPWTHSCVHAPAPHRPTGSGSIRL